MAQSSIRVCVNGIDQSPAQPKLASTREFFLHVHIIRIWQLQHQIEYVAPLVRGLFCGGYDTDTLLSLKCLFKTRLHVCNVIADRKLGGHWTTAACRSRHARRKLIRMNAEL